MSNQPYFDTLVSMLRQRAAAAPDQRIYTYLVDGELEEQHITYAELDARARLIATQLQKVGPPGERALLLYPPGLEYVAAFFGCLYAGWIAVPSYPPSRKRQDPRLLAIIEDAQAKVALTDNMIWTALEPFLDVFPQLKAFEWVVTDTLNPAEATQWQQPDISRESLAFFQYTSGSTGKPKGVMLTHGNLLGNLELIHHAFGLQEGERGASWLPPYHDMGLIGGILQPIFCNGYTVLMSPLDFLQKPVRWLQAISRYGVTVAGGPNFAYDWCVERISAEDRADIDLSTWNLAFNGAEPIRSASLERFAKTYTQHGFQHHAFFPCYGLAEGTLIVSGGQRAGSPVLGTFSAENLEQNQAVVVGDGAADARTLVGSGRTLLDQEIRIVDPQSRLECPDNIVGEIWVKGRSIAQGYWNKPVVSAETLNATLADDNSGPYLRTGDLGFLHQGELFVTGRLKDLIIIRGRNFYPQDIEFTVAACHEAVQPNAGAAFSVDVEDVEKLVVVQELKRTHRKADPKTVINAIREAVGREHELQVHAVVLLKPRTIPKTSSGKIQRRLSRANYLKNRLEIIEQDTFEVVEEAAPKEEESFLRKSLLAVPDTNTQQMLVSFFLQEQIAERLKRSKSDIDTSQSLTIYGLDSLMAIEIKNQTEQILGIELPLVALIEGPSIDELAEIIVERLTTDSTMTKLQANPHPPVEFGLSAGQQALWYLYQLAPHSSVYNVARAGRVQGRLDGAALTQAVEQLVERHPILRTTFHLKGSEPTQKVHATLAADFETVTLANEAEITDSINAAAQQPFDLENGSLLRIRVYPQQDETILLIALHHIVTDFWSLVLLVEELVTLYTAAAQKDAGQSVTAPHLRFSDIVAWQNDRLSGVGGAKLWKFWQENLAGDLPTLNLPTDFARPPVQTYAGATVVSGLGQNLTQNINQLASDSGATRYMMLLAAYQLLLHRISGQDDILVGTPTAGRDQSQLADVMGYLVNPVVLRQQFGEAQTFKTLLQQVRQTVLAAFEHQDFPFPTLVERLKLDRNPSYSPLIQTLFVVQKSHSAENSALAAFALGAENVSLQMGDLTISTLPLEQTAAQFDLSLAMAEIDGEWVTSWEYNTDLFEAATIERLSHHFNTLLESIVANPNELVGQLDLLTGADKTLQISEWNATEQPYLTNVCLHTLFEQQVDKTPDAIALVYENETLTYAQLDQKANQLAHFLQANGVAPDSMVGVCMERSLEIVIALYAVLKAGGAYVPIDPTYPAERVAFMLADAQVPVLLTQSEIAIPPTDSKTIALDSEWATIAEFSAERPTSNTTSTHLAYTIYTSGSTGQPKGAMNSHRGIVNRLLWMQEAFQLDASDRVLQKTPFSFDVSVWEFFWPLLTGARLVVARPGGHLDSTYLRDTINQHAITTLHFVPSMLQLFLDEPAIADCRSLRRVILSGEALPYDLLTRFYDTIDAELHNLYGPTEAAIDVSWWHCQPNSAQRVPIGKPVANTQLYVLDANLQPVPVGVAGELYIGGVQVARGYWNRPKLTQERFIPDPFSDDPEAKLYKTGDLVRTLSDGNIVFIGRTDFQVKIRGLRVELGEVEARLSQHAAIRECLVVAADQRLVAYYVCHGGMAVEPADLRSELQAVLPAHMVPAIFMPLDAFPLSPNGKVNRKRLPKPAVERATIGNDFVAPRSHIEQTIAAVWADLLNVTPVGLHDNFFDLGGHSLLLVQAHRELQSQLATDIPLVKLLEKPTVSSLAQALANGHDAEPVLAASQARAEQQRGARRRYR